MESMEGHGGTWRDMEGHGGTWRDMKGEETYEQPLRSASLTSPPATAFPIFFYNLSQLQNYTFFNALQAGGFEIFGNNCSLEERL